MAHVMLKSVASLWFEPAWRKIFNVILRCFVFRLHDFDNNTKLDGLEIYKALTHLLPFEPESEDKYKVSADHNQGKSKEEIESMRKDDELQYYSGTDWKKNDSKTACF